MKQKKYYDLEDKEMYDAEAIDVKYAKYFRDAKYTPLLFWKKHPDSKVCVDFTYKISEPDDLLSRVYYALDNQSEMADKRKRDPSRLVDGRQAYSMLLRCNP